MKGTSRTILALQTKHHQEQVNQSTQNEEWPARRHQTNRSWHPIKALGSKSPDSSYPKHVTGAKNCTPDQLHALGAQHLWHPIHVPSADWPADKIVAPHICNGCRNGNHFVLRNRLQSYLQPPSVRTTWSHDRYEVQYRSSPNHRRTSDTSFTAMLVGSYFATNCRHIDT